MRPITTPLLALLVSLGTQPVPAQNMPAMPSSTANSQDRSEVRTVATPIAPPAGAPQLTRADLAAWLDGFLPYALERGDVAGAVVVVVRDEEILLQKGYGYSDVAARKPVDPARTLFRPGSISKLFTWTAVMQLVERGELDLDTDVNEYLDFEIPPRAGGPITLRHIMTHTAGFEEVIRALIVSEPEDLTSLREALTHWIPSRVFPAGSTPAYSNYATALAGYIVQRVSGEPFNEYIERHIFAPLGMRYSTFRQPLPERLEPWMSKGYALGSGEPKPYELISLAPAGSLAASGADMGRFMIAHLTSGAFGSERILQASTAQRMHSTALTMIPPLNRMLLGFYETNINGRQVIAHGGNTQWFHSYLRLFLDDGIGLYLSLNSAGRGDTQHAIHTALFHGFSNRYLPGPAPDGSVDEKIAQQHAQLIAGHYDNSRGSRTSFLAAMNLLSQVEVVANEDGTITVPDLTGLNGQPRTWREIASFVWRDVRGEDLLAAVVEKGRLVRWSADPFSAFMVFEPTPWWRSSAWLLPLLVVSLVTLALTALAWPVSALVRRHYGVGYRLTGRNARAHRLVRIASLLVLLTMLAALVTVGLILNDLAWAAPGTDLWIQVLRPVALVVFVGGAVIALWNAWTVLRGRRRWLAKLWALALAAACVTVLWVGIVFHIVGFGANY